MYFYDWKGNKSFDPLKPFIYFIRKYIKKSEKSSQFFIACFNNILYICC